MKVDADAAHEALCDGFGISNGRGSQTAVAARLEISPQMYQKLWQGKVGSKTLERWMNEAGYDMRVVFVRQ